MSPTKNSNSSRVVCIISCLCYVIITLLASAKCLRYFFVASISAVNVPHHAFLLYLYQYSILKLINSQYFFLELMYYTDHVALSHVV